MSRNLLTAALTAVVGTTLMSMATSSTRPADQQLADIDAVTLVRQLNTAEAELFGSKNGSHRYATLAKLLETPTLKGRVKVAVAVSDETSGTVRNYTVSLITSPEGSHYMLGLAPKGCEPAFFSNETGIIYPGKAAGCE